MKDSLEFLFKTHIGRSVFCVGLAAVCLFIANYIDWMKWVSAALFIIYPLPYAIVAIVYGCIINPIKDYKENKILKKLWSDFNSWSLLMQADGYSEDWNALGNKYVRNYKILGDISRFKTPMELNNECSKKDLN